LKAIPCIDLFAGPGGLGEGFSSLSDAREKSVFNIMLSIEKDPHAYQTLLLRSFFRQFQRGQVPVKYYEYLAGAFTRQELFSSFPLQAKSAGQEAWLAELGNDETPDSLIDKRITEALGGRKDWLLIGGPPCQAYSLVGRSRMRGEDVEKHETDLRHFLYREYLRILAVHRPPVFIMENVKGLLSATLKKERMFQRILADLAHPGTAIDEKSKRNH
jgi:DNA (cytosine-5)-methyltransferase 1